MAKTVDYFTVFCYTSTIKEYRFSELVMKRQLIALAAASLVSTVAHAQGYPLGARVYQSFDTEKNTVTKVMGEYWVDGKNSQNGVIVDSKMQSFYNDGDVSFQQSGKLLGTPQLGRPLLSVQTTSPERAGGYYNFARPVSLRNKSIRFRVRANDWPQIKEMNLTLSTGDDKFARTLTLDLTTKLHNQTDNHWVEVTASISDFDRFNNPDIDNVQALLWQIRDRGTYRIATNLDRFEIIDNGSHSKVSITIDDGLVDDLIAKQIMDQYGMRGTLFIDPTTIGTKGFLTQAQIDQFAQAGWDIGGHDVNYTLRKMTQEQINEFARQTAEYLKAHNYRGANLFAFPGGINDPRVNQAIAEHFKYGLNVDGTSNPSSTLSHMRINRKAIDSVTTVAQVKQWIDAAKANNEYLILSFHSFDNPASGDENMKSADFKEIIDYIHRTELASMPVSQGVEAVAVVESLVPPQELDVADVGPVTLVNPRRQDFGIGVAQTAYTNPGAAYSGQEIQFLANYNDGNYALKGGLGVGTLNGVTGARTYLVGDMTGMKFVNKNMLVSLGVYGDVVNSVNGLAQGITQQGWSVGTDLYNDYGGISISGTQSYFTGGNTQTGATVMPYVNTPIPGVYVYVKDKYYTNSQPWNENYYSPDHYNRVVGGVGWRKAIGDNVYSGWADFGSAVASGYHSPAGSAKFAVDHVDSKNLTYGVTVGTDVSAAGNYQYFYADIHAKYTF